MVSYSNVIDVNLGVPEFACPAGVADQWQESFKLNAQRINTKRKARVGTPESFSQVLASPCSQEYRGYLSSGYISRKGRTGEQSTQSHRQNLSRAFNKYNDKLDYAFAGGPGGSPSRFEDSIDNGKDAYIAGNEARTLRITGCKEAGLGLAGIATKLLTGETNVEQYFRGCDEVNAVEVVPVPYEVLIQAFRSMLPGMLTQQGTELIKSGCSDEVLDIVNYQLLILMQRIADPMMTRLARPYDGPTWSFYGWVVNDSRVPMLRIKVCRQYF